MKWATRAGCHVDRTACAWLIRRFIDAEATFIFVVDPADIPIDATPFDVAGAPFSHRGGSSTFEVMIDHYRISSGGLDRLAEVVHEADIEDERFDAPEAAGLDTLIAGLRLVTSGDHELIDAALPVYDALLARFASLEPGRLASD